MEVQMSAQGPKSTGTSSDGGGIIANKPVPGYMRPSAGSCHHVCKYGGTHTFEDHNHNHNHKEPHSRPHPRPPRKQPPPPAPAESQKHSHNRVLVKVRSVFRRRVVDSTSSSNSNSTTASYKPSKKVAAGNDKSGKAANAIAKVGDGSVEWKDIAAYDTVPPQPHGSSIQNQAVIKGNKKKSYGKAKVVHEHVEDDGVEEGRQNEPLDTKATNTDSTNKSINPQEAKKSKPTALLVENVAEMLQVQGYQILSPSLAQSRANLLRDLEKEMMAQQQEQEQEQEQEAANLKEEQTTTTTSSTHVLDPEEYAAAAAAAESSSRPIPAHRRVQSMSMGMSSSRSVRHAFGRQASRNSSSGAVFKVRSRSTRAAPPAAGVGFVLPPGEEKDKPPARLRSRRGSIGGDKDGSCSVASTGRGIHLRIRSLRRRGVGGSGGAGTGFVVPAVALRHQKTLDKKKSQRLYNNLIEETASSLVKTRKSRVKALVGAFESVISKIAK